MNRVLLIIFSCSLFLSSCKVSRFVVYNFSNITDYKIFPERKVSNNSSPFVFATTNQPSTFGSFKVDGKEIPFEQYLDDNETVAFMIIHNDRIMYEKYFNKYNETSIVASFSMAKSITSILIGCALDDKLIKSVDEPIINYIPELAKNGFENITIKHLLQMTSGIKFNESYYNPFGDAATFYYGTGLLRAVKKMKSEADPGTRFKYSSGDSQVLGLVLQRALKDKSISQYLEEKIWQPLGMEYPASWSLDKKNGMEKTFCCVNARARDFAKIGRLYLHQGNWNGIQIVSQNWVSESTKVDTTDNSKWYYQHQWWLPSKEGDYLANGHLGQYIYVHPDKNLIIVRLGKKEGNVKWQSIFRNLASLY
ncbi:MAG TPA: serine hydrolase [Sphingobacterium sp.]|nr:serine hydrolase [Sphingobacterium sp.]